MGEGSEESKMEMDDRGESRAIAATDDRKTYSVFVLPYVHLREERLVAGVWFVPSDSKRWEEHPAVMKDLRGFLNCYRDGLGRQITKCTLGFIEPIERICYTKEEIRDVRQAIDLLCFAVVSPTETLIPVYSDNFMWDLFESHVGARALSIRIGVVDIYAPSMTTFARGASVHIQSAEVALDGTEGDLLNALNECLVRSRDRRDGDTYSRILRAVRWFNMGHAVDDYGDGVTSIVMLAIALESLLDCPEGVTGAYFSRVIETLVPVREISRWAQSFYKVRSKIVHGGDVTESLMYGGDKHVSHFWIGRAVFLQCLRSRLELLGLSEQQPVGRFSRMFRIEQSMESNRSRLKRVKAASENEQLSTSPVAVNRLIEELRRVNRIDQSLKAAEIQEFLAVVDRVRNREDLKVLDEARLRDALDEATNVLRGM